MEVKEKIVFGQRKVSNVRECVVGGDINVSNIDKSNQ